MDSIFDEENETTKKGTDEIPENVEDIDESLENAEDIDESPENEAVTDLEKHIVTAPLKDEEESEEEREARIRERKERNKSQDTQSLQEKRSLEIAEAASKWWLILICLLAVIFATIYATSKGNGPVELKDDYKRVSLTEFWDMVDEGKVEAIYADKANYLDFDILLFNEETLTMTYGDRRNYTGHSSEDYLVCMHPGTDDFRERVLMAGVDYRKKVQGTTKADKQDSLFDTLMAVLSTIPSLALIAVMCIFLVYMLKTMRKDLVSHVSEVVTEGNVTKRFEDVIGLDEIVDDVKFIVTLVKNPNKGEDIGAKPPKGILFSGPPGTGKTLLAKAIAGEAGVPFIYLNASNLIELYVGMGAKRVRDTFETARKKAPCVVFIDEIDAVGTSREELDSNSERKQTVNALLQELDGFKASSGIVVIAATNTPGVLDKALTRAGRFDREVVVAPPKNWQAREKLFKYYTEVLRISDDVNIETLAKETIGFTGADIEAICNDAAIIALAADRKRICMNDFEEAIDKRILKGNKRKSEVDKDTTIIAYHEAGHAVMAYLHKKEIARATIVGSTSGVGGFVLHTEKDSMFTTKSEFIDSIMGAYAGRASEEIKFGAEKITTGASSDIQAATQTLMQYMSNYGFDADMGMIDYSYLVKNQIIAKEDFNSKIKELANKFYKDTVSELRDNYHLVERLANKLLEEETLSGSEIAELLSE